MFGVAERGVPNSAVIACFRCSAAVGGHSKGIIDMRLRSQLKRFGLSERGATAIEYGLIAALISVAIIAALRLTGNALKNVFNSVGTTLSSPTN